jgi:hypothetical protein
MSIKKNEVTPEILDVIKNAAGLGMTQKDIAYLINAKFRSLRRWLADDPEIKEAYEEGKAQIKYVVGMKLMDKINEGDTVSILFYLKCQCQWREKAIAETEQIKPTIYLPQKDEKQH